MKQLAHFAVGAAVASCFPFAIEAGLQGNPFYFLLGGCCGLLPDRLDEMIGNLFHRRDVEVAPDPLRTDAGLIADTITDVIHHVHVTRRPLTLRLHTCRIGCDTWRPYGVRFDVGRQRVEVAYGPHPDEDRPAAAPDAQPRAIRPLDCAVKIESRALTQVHAGDGPSFRFTPDARGTVFIACQPWHRAWSHSFCVAGGVGLLAAMGAGWRAGLLGVAAYGMHVVIDQLDHGSAKLFFPLDHARRQSMRWFHSQRVFPNLMLFWAACLLIFWNASRFNPVPQRFANPLQLLFFGLVLPVLVYRWLNHLLADTRHD